MKYKRLVDIKYMFPSDRKSFGSFPHLLSDHGDDGQCGCTGHAVRGAKRG